MALMRVTEIALASLLLTSPLPGQAEEPGSQAVFEGETSVLVVELPVQVVRRGRSVEGLEAAQFRIFDRGIERELSGFEVLEEAPRSGPASLSPGVDNASTRAVGPRSYLLVFDFAYGSGESLSRALRACWNLLAREIQEKDRVAVAFFSALRGFRVVSDFTSDETITRAALGVVGEMLARRPERAGSLLREIRLASDENLSRSTRSPLVSLDEVEREAWVLVKNDPFWAHRSVIRDLARGLAGVPAWAQDRAGLKRILLFSHGFESRHFLGRGGASTLRELEAAFRSLRAHRWAIQAFNTGGLRAGAGREALFLLAHETGGESYENFNDLDEAMELMLAKNRVTYLLAFRADDVPRNGRFRRLRVKLEGGPPGARLVHRPGYYALPPSR